MMDIEIVVNKEINDYKESIFFGLSLRQFICSVSAIIMAVVLYLLLIDKLGRQLTSWLCIIGAAPLAVAGFFHYNGLTLERFIWAVIKTNYLLAGRRLYRAENYSYQFMQILQDGLEKQSKPQSWQKQFAQARKLLPSFGMTMASATFAHSQQKAWRKKQNTIGMKPSSTQSSVARKSILQQ